MHTFSFQIQAADNKSRAKLGIITTPHGIIRTPASFPLPRTPCVSSGYNS